MEQPAMQYAAMHDELTFILVSVIITAIALLILLLLASSIVRRLRNERRYRETDACKKDFDRILRAALPKPDADLVHRLRSIPPGSTRGQALEQTLMELMEADVHASAARSLLHEFGYVERYERSLMRGSVMQRAAAIATLGRIRCESSLQRLLPLLDGTEPEIVSVAARAISRFRAPVGLAAVVSRLPNLLEKGLITRKAMERILLNFGDDAIPALVESRYDDVDPWVLSCVLEILSHLSPDPRAVTLAEGQLMSGNPEVRSKALKVLGRSGITATQQTERDILRLLEDPAWFVRIQAARAAEALKLVRAAKLLGRLLFDANWQVRNEAAQALSGIGEAGHDIFIEVLSTADQYAKESVCEEIERSGFTERLIRDLASEDQAASRRATNILTIMHRLRFSTPLTEFLELGTEDAAAAKVRAILAEEQAA